jgi:predicted phage terminase large subunit-like protein
LDGPDSRSFVGRKYERVFAQPLERDEAPGTVPGEFTEAIARRVHAKEDRLWFYRHYLPLLFTHPYVDGHAALGRALDDNAYLLVLAFRGWGKSTLVTFAETLRLLVTRQVDFAVLTGRSEGLTTPLVLQLRQELETNEALRRDFGPFEPGAVWQNSHFALASGLEVLGRPLGGSARGLRSLANRRPQLWVLDDLQELEDARSLERIERVLDFVKSVVIPAMQPPEQGAAVDGQGASGSGGCTAGALRADRRSLIRVVGTKMSEDCALARLDAEPGFVTFRLDAEDGNLQTPADGFRFPIALLRERKALLGSDAYAREYMNTAVSREGMVRRPWLRPYRPEELRGRSLRCAVFWDPAIGPEGDFKAIVSLALDSATGVYFVLDAFLERTASPDEQVRELFRQWERALDMSAGAALCGYEANGMQSLLEYPLERYQREFGLPPMPLRRLIHSENKAHRVATLVPLFEQGKILFDPAAPGQQTLMDQWVFWPRRGTDGPDAMHGAWHLLQGARGANDTLVTLRPQQDAWES